MGAPLFAADIIGILFGILFLVISAVSAISNIAKEKNKPQPGKIKQKAALQNELEKFLQEAINPKQQKKQKPVEVDFFEEDDFEIAAPVQQAPQRRRRQQNKSQPQRRQSQQARQKMQPVNKPVEASNDSQKSLRERAELEARKRQERLGGSVRERIQEKQQTHVQTSIQTNIGGNVNKHLSEKFGSLSDEPKRRATKRSEVKINRSLIKNPKSLRQAIILNEILSPPIALRRS
ncbi:hypothetical protein [Gimesia aquarii]|uniref:Uncharacterized protein n=1 Tax=Gimesia aquarii TaxID=2527964 RepID=A0A517WP37_9PLAN|nr:hypothetical protein [Gimesia aquarii]QDU07013.1 hypothetical protein V202x_03580 [Gimesia aquarii]